MKKIPEKIQAIHFEFVRYGRNAREWMRKCEMLLPHVERERVWEKKGFGSIYEYAAKLAGMGRNKVDCVLWTMRKVEDKKEILKVVEEKGVSAVRPIANLVTFENQSFWAEKASQMSVRTLETYARDFKRERLKEERLKEVDLNQKGLLESKNDVNSCHVARKIVSMELESELAQELEKLKDRQGWNTLIKELLEARRELAERKRQELEAIKPQKVRTDSKTMPAKIGNYVRARANNKCEAPGCTHKGEHLHHTVPFSLRHEHDPDNIRLLCKNHHNIAHHGLIENEEQAPENWRLREHANTWEFRSLIDGRVAEYKAKAIEKRTLGSEPLGKGT